MIEIKIDESVILFGSPKFAIGQFLRSPSPNPGGTAIV